MKRTIFTLSAIMVIFTLAAAAPALAKNKKGKVKLAYVEWACATASTHVVKAVIETRLGYDVEVTPVSAPAMYQAIAAKDQDGMTAAWLPVTHGDMINKFGDKLVDLGPNFTGARIGWVVPSYVTIDTITEMPSVAEKFNGKIIGIDPGAGLMKKSEVALKEYGLTGYELIDSSGAAMTASLANAYRRKDWVVVTGWVPHWKFAAFDLKMLKDPKNVFGDAETINTIVRKGLKEDMPDVYRFLDNFFWTSAQIGAVMKMNKDDDSDVYENALKWVKENPAVVDAWLK